VIKEVGKDDDQAAPGHAFRQLVKDAADAGFRPGRRYSAALAE
jgi:hypothetical protein